MNPKRDPRLIVLSGREKKMQSIINRGYLKPGELNDYPELMGILPVIGAIAAALPAGISIVKDIFSSITGGKDDSSIIEQQIILQQQQAAETQKLLIYGGLGLGAILVLTMVMKK